MHQKPYHVDDDLARSEFVSILTLQEVNDEDDGSEFEVVFISSDDDAAAAHKYLQEMHANWLMLPYDSPLRQELKRKLRIFGAKEQEVY